ncbi:peptide-binding protein [Rhodococcus sp. 06-470-2]|uniref:DUF3662 and FHA domain-containing protein n=1 Tax=unclassified Rhodococcus (in: high G+C Gram-positive bacteria) TaxID=192944 RepID=UPI000B9AF97F|nr:MULTISPECIES: DUF3662 and FHA domain-containing protein [unclassified Rhodococcus (in: high G+C Gram-positive bacteria)]OZC65464.1 peptide-binding protein [Rhodococcus sp. 06-470-2]OZE70723.1 peptide-binding protein [Rhodococcus sp. 05-2221-1B]
MGIVQRFERKLQGAVGDVFARVFGGGVVPAEVEAALQQEASDLVRPLDGGHLLAPNSYVITINSSDHDELAGDRELTVKAFSRHLGDYIRDQGWQTYGDVVVRFEPSPTLHTGQFRASGSVDPDVGRSATAGRNAQQGASAPKNVSAPPAPSPVPSATQRPSAPPMSIPGAGHMTQNPGYDPQRDPADGHRPDPRTRNGYAGGQDPRYPAREQNGYDAQAYAPADHDPRYDQQPYNGGYDEQSYPEQGQAYSAAGQEQGYDPNAYGAPGGQDQGYGAQGYDAQGYDGQAYDAQAYNAQGYNGQGYDYNAAEQGAAYSEAPYQEQAYNDPAGRYAEPQAAGYQQPGYQQPGYDYPPAPAAYGRGYPQGAGDRGDGYGYDQPASYAGRSQALAATLQLEDGSGRYFQLRDGQNIIGRGQDAQFRLPDTGVSRRHIEIRWDGRVAMLSDLGSTNGTTVNGAPVQDWQLADGDVIRAGHSEILVRIV